MVEKIQQTALFQSKSSEVKTADDFNKEIQEKLKNAISFEQNTGNNITFGELRDIKLFIENYKKNPEMSKICEDYTKYINVMLEKENDGKTKQVTNADKKLAVKILLSDSSKNESDSSLVLNQTSISYNTFSLFENENNGKGVNPKFNQYDKNGSVFNK